MRIALVFLMCQMTTIDAATTIEYPEETSPAYGVCGYPHYGPSGVISSPNYPYSYYNYLYCDEYIYASSGSSLSFFFKSFATEQCCDYVTVSCPNNSSFPPQQFSGYSLPEPVSIPWCSLALVNFRTDGSGTASGFSLDYYVSDGGCGNTVYNDSFGYVTSPNYPSYYGYNQNCSNIIWAPQRSTFYLYFQYFYLESDCSHDWLQIKCLDNSFQGAYGYCGSYGPHYLNIYGCTQALLWFHSDGSSNYPGFNIQYSVYPESVSGETDHWETTVPAGEVPTDSPVCGDVSYDPPYWVIRSPNYPAFYPNNLYCDYNVYAPTGSSLSFIFDSFHVDQSDTVTISCPPNSNIPPQDFSGHSLPNPVSMPVCSQGRVNFRTDYTNASSGFSIFYYVNAPGCGNTVYIGSNGYVNSPFWPDFYGYNQNCSNIIWTTEQNTIQLNFHSFNLQDNCSADYLEISCLDGSNFGPTRYCGNYNSYNLYIQQCSVVLLLFHSDDSDNYQGFNIEYTIYPVGACGELSYYGPSGVISSPDYPLSYPNFLYCDNIIYATTGSSLLLVFNSFNTEESVDIVTISCPANSSYPAYQYSGSYLPSPLSFPDCSQGLVNFHTDSSTVASGFNLTYYVNEGGCGNTLYYPYSGYVTSPNWADNYGFNQNCYNIIFGSGRSTFYLNFKAFILQSCCSCDWLEISCVDNSDYGPTRYCGAYAPTSTYIYNCSQVLLWFHSDSSINDQGFEMEYTVYTSVDDSKEPSNGTLNEAEQAPPKIKPKSADSVPSDGKPKAAESVPNSGKPRAQGIVPSDKKPEA